MSENNKVNILMVDDQPAKLLSYEVILDELGLNLIKATSGRDALEQLLKTDVAVVLMDVSIDRKSTRLNSSHRCISYAVFCLKKKKNKTEKIHNNDEQKQDETEDMH